MLKLLIGITPHICFFILSVIAIANALIRVKTSGINASNRTDKHVKLLLKVNNFHFGADIFFLDHIAILFHLIITFLPFTIYNPFWVGWPLMRRPSSV